MLQDIDWNLKSSKMFNETLQCHVQGLKMSQRFCWKTEFANTWDCLLWRQKCQRVITFEDKYTWHWLLLKTGVPVELLILKTKLLTLITFEGKDIRDCLPLKIKAPLNLTTSWTNHLKTQPHFSEYDFLKCLSTLLELLHTDTVTEQQALWS